ncbi:MAG: nucleotide exchange factor GrpE [Nitrosotalea sp.]
MQNNRIGLTSNNDEIDDLLNGVTGNSAEGKEQGAENIEELKNQLEREKEKVTSQEKKIQYLLADFENLKKRTESDVQNKVNSITDDLILKFLSIYDDFIRARDALSKQNVNVDGLDAILKNMNSFLSEYGIRPIEALGEVFDPRLHEAMSIRDDSSLDDNTITAELRKGYILKDRVIRPSLVEISKKHKEMKN